MPFRNRVSPRSGPLSTGRFCDTRILRTGSRMSAPARRVVYLLAIGSAAVYGAADFLGGLAARRASTVAVVVASQCTGLVLLVAALPLLPAAAPSSTDLIWGAAAGCTGGTGVALLYRALAVGTMAVVAPITAVCAVIIPVLADIATGERLLPQTTAGIGLALVAIVLVSQQRPPTTLSELRRGVAPAAPAGLLPRGIWLALLSGVAIGLFFLSLARTEADAGMWPLVAARLASVTIFFVIAVAARRSLRMDPSVARVAIAGGALDMLANALYLIASRAGALSVVVTLTSLYPASTVLLARVVLGERLNAWQVVGIVCALMAIVLIVGGA